MARWPERIAIDEAVLGGKPVVKGTRLAVEFVVRAVAQGWAQADVLENYPGIEQADIQACLEYAAELLRREKVFPRAG